MTNGRYLTAYMDDSLYTYQATLVRVVDADTMIFDIDLGFHIHVNLRVRLARVNAPESDTEEGEKATEYVAKKLMGRIVHIKTEKDKTDKYGRYLAEVYFLEPLDSTKDQWVNLSDLLLNQGMAEPYEDG